MFVAEEDRPFDKSKNDENLGLPSHELKAKIVASDNSSFTDFCILDNKLPK